MTAHANTPVKRPLFRRILQAFVDIRELTLIMLITVIIVVMANINPYFFSFSNFRAVAVGMTPTAIIVIGMAILLASGGFEANDDLRKFFIGKEWLKAKVRGTPHNTGDGLNMALKLGAKKNGLYDGCHATPMDLHMKNAIAFSSLIYCFLGASMGLKPHRKSSAMGIGISLIVIFIYIILMAIGNGLGLSKTIPPIIAAWFPNIVIGTSSIFLVKKLASD